MKKINWVYVGERIRHPGMLVEQLRQWWWVRGMNQFMAGCDLETEYQLLDGAIIDAGDLCYTEMVLEDEKQREQKELADFLDYDEGGGVW